MANRFKDKHRREMYDNTVNAYRNKSKALFNAKGERHVGSTFARYFWQGFDNQNPYPCSNDNTWKTWEVYPCWRAGQDMGQEYDHS